MRTHVQGIPVADVAARVHREYKRLVDNAFNAAIDNVARDLSTDPDWVREAAERPALWDTRIPSKHVVWDTEMGEYGLDDCEFYGRPDTFDCWGRVGGLIVVDEHDEGKLRYVFCEGHYNGEKAGS